MGYPKGHKYFSLPNEKRNRPGVAFTLSPEAIACLDEMSNDTRTPRSQIIEKLIMTAWARFHRRYG